MIVKRLIRFAIKAVRSLAAVEEILFSTLARANAINLSTSVFHIESY